MFQHACLIYSSSRKLRVYETIKGKRHACCYSPVPNHYIGVAAALAKSSPNDERALTTSRHLFAPRGHLPNTWTTRNSLASAHRARHSGFPATSFRQRLMKACCSSTRCSLRVLTTTIVRVKLLRLNPLGRPALMWTTCCTSSSALLFQKCRQQQTASPTSQIQGLDQQDQASQ